MEKVLDVELRPCPLCRHKAVMELECEVMDGVMADRVRCLYCGCRIGAPYTGEMKKRDGSHDWNVKYLQSAWNKRAEYCQFCGEMVGAVENCPKCGQVLLAQG